MIFFLFQVRHSRVSKHCVYRKCSQHLWPTPSSATGRASSPRWDLWCSDTRPFRTSSQRTFGRLKVFCLVELAFSGGVSCILSRVSQTSFLCSNFYIANLFMPFEHNWPCICICMRAIHRYKAIQLT